MISIGVIGYGYWGPNIVRNFQSIDLGCVKMVSDLNGDALSKVKKLYPSIQTTTKAFDILRSKDIDAVAVITPVATHYPLVKEALLNGKHVFVEKPFTDNADRKEKPPDYGGPHVSFHRRGHEGEGVDRFRYPGEDLLL